MPNDMTAVSQNVVKPNCVQVNQYGGKEDCERGVDTFSHYVKRHINGWRNGYGDNGGERDKVAMEIIKNDVNEIVSSCNAMEPKHRAYCFYVGYRDLTELSMIADTVNLITQSKSKTTVSAEHVIVLETPAGLYTPEMIQKETASENNTTPAQAVITRQSSQPTPSYTKEKPDLIEKQYSRQSTENNNTQNTQEKTRNSGGFLSLIVGFGFLLTLVTSPFLVFFGATNQVVVFYDAKDAGWSFLPVPMVLVAAAITPDLKDGFLSIIMSLMIMTALISVGAFSAWKSVQNSIIHTRSKTLGYTIGTLKLFAAPGIAAIALEHWNKMTAPNRTAGERMASGAFLAFLVWIAKSLVNGEKVYENKGWVQQKDVEPETGERFKKTELLEISPAKNKPKMDM